MSKLIRKSKLGDNFSFLYKISIIYLIIESKKITTQSVKSNIEDQNSLKYNQYNFVENQDAYWNVNENKRNLQTVLSGECYNNQQIYPISFGDSVNEQVTAMHVIQSNQDSDTSTNDKEDWIAIGGHSQSSDLVGSSTKNRAFIALLQYIAGLKWAYYDRSETISSISSCKFASNGLQVVYLTTKPMHIIVIETLSGSIVNVLKTPSRYEQTISGLESRIQSSAGMFLAYQTFNGDQPTNWQVIEFNQTSGKTIWSMNIGSYDSATQVQELAYTGVQTDSYERLYIVGRNGQNQNMLASIDTSQGSDIVNFQKIYTQNSPNYRIQHISVKYLNLAMCGDDGVQVGLIEHEKVWAAIATITKSSNQLNYQKDFQFNHPNYKYCGGVFTDAQYLYVLIVSDLFVSGHYQAFVFKKDINAFTDNHLKAIDLASSVSLLYPIINTFQVKAENGKRTFFFSGSTDALGSLQLNKRTNFVQKFTFDATTYSCIAQNNYDSFISQFVTSEGSTPTFIGTTSSLGLWVDSTSQIVNGVSVVNLVTVDYQADLSLERIKYFPKSHDACISLAKTTTKNKILTVQNYYVGQTAKYYRFETFIQQLGSKQCTDITFFFFAQLKEGTTIPTFIKFDGANRIFQVFSNVTSDARSYDIIVTGYPSIGEPTSFQWTLNVKLNLPPKFQDSLKSAKLYYDEIKRIQLPAINIVTDAQVFISVSLHDKLYLPQWIDYDPTKMQISFNPNNSKYIGQYDIDVILTESISFLTSTFTFTAFVVDKNFDLTDADKYQNFDVQLQAFSNGFVSLQFSTPIANYKTINLTQSISLRISGDAEFEDESQIDDGVASPYNFDYKVLNFNMTNIDFQLIFDNPSQIGLFQNPDYINVKFLNNKTFLGQKLEIIRNTSINSMAPIPRLTSYKSDQYETASILSLVSLYIMLFLILLCIIARLYTGTKLNQLIRLILILQIMEYFPLLKLNLPTFLIFGLSDISYYCFSWTRKREVYQNLFEDHDGKQFGQIYKYIGIQSQNYLTNVGDIFLLSGILIFIYLFLYVLMMLFLILCVLLILKKMGRLNEETKKQKYGALYMDLKTNEKISILAHQLQLFRFIFLAIVIVYLESYPKIQTSAIFSITTLLQLYYMIYQPYEKGLDNIQTILNESTILVAVIFYFFFSDMTLKIQPKMTAGWYLIYSYSFIILVNGAFIIYKIVYDFRVMKGWIKNESLESIDSPDKVIQIKPGKEGDDAFEAKKQPTEIDDTKKYKRRRTAKLKNQDEVAVFYDQSPNQQQKYKNVKVNESNLTDNSVFMDQKSNYAANDVVYEDLEVDVQGAKNVNYGGKTKQTIESDRNIQFSTNDIVPMPRYFRRIIDKVETKNTVQDEKVENLQSSNYIRANPRTVKIKNEFKKKEYKDD